MTHAAFSPPGRFRCFQGGKDTDRLAGRREEMAQMSMHCESSSAVAVLSYGGGHGGSQGAADEHFLPAAGRPLDERRLS